MNWDYKHSLSIQIERQRCNISCGLRRWKWFTFKDVAASFHYFKVLSISMGRAMTDSRVREEQDGGGWDFFHAPTKETLSRGFAACAAQTLSFIPPAPRGQSTVSAGRTMVLTFGVFLDPPKGSTVHPHCHPSLCKPPSLTIQIYSGYSGPSPCVSPASSLTPAGIKKSPLLLGQISLLPWPPLWG